MMAVEWSATGVSQLPPMLIFAHPVVSGVLAARVSEASAESDDRRQYGGELSTNGRSRRRDAGRSGSHAADRRRDTVRLHG